MFQKIENEIKKHCSACPHAEACLRRKCFAYRIKQLVLSTFNPSTINIDDFFEPPENSQISMFDFGEGEGF